MSDESVICPACQAENDALRRACISCGESLIVVCPHCNTINAVTAGQCFACGQQFDALGHIMARHEVRFEDRFTRQAATAIDSRSEQRMQNQARSQELWEQERRRQAYLQAQKQRQKQQERYLIIGVMAVAAVLLAIVLIASLAH